ncbi:MAG: outer membrane lipoprotein-sorting protein [Rhodothermales bacterium]
MSFSTGFAVALIGMSLTVLEPHLVVAQPSADEVLARMDELQRQYKNESARLEMRLFDEGRQIRRRELKLFSSRDAAGHIRALVEFTDPPDIRGLRLLTIQTDDGDDQRIYLPALRRIQRIAGSARENRFAGSDLSYEDLRVRNREDYTSRIMDSTASHWTIESIPKDKDSPYGRIVSEIDKEMYVVTKARYFDREDRLRKVLTATDFEDMGDHVWKASNITMEDVRAERRTELEYLQRDLQTAISPDVFTDRYLRRGVQ